MKKSRLLHSELSYLTATLGHTDEITIADAGLPIPDEVSRIDLALTHGVPTFIQTVEVLLQESQVESVIIAEEMKTHNRERYEELQKILLKEHEKNGREIPMTEVSHEEFKSKTIGSKAVVRTGECSPYANVIFQMGVTF